MWKFRIGNWFALDACLPVNPSDSMTLHKIRGLPHWKNGNLILWLLVHWDENSVSPGRKDSTDAKREAMKSIKKAAESHSEKVQSYYCPLLSWFMNYSPWKHCPVPPLYLAGCTWINRASWMWIPSSYVATLDLKYLFWLEATKDVLLCHSIKYLGCGAVESHMDGCKRGKNLISE